MRTTLLSFTVILLNISTNLDAQTFILGTYENQTGATERMGELIEILPDHKVNLYSKYYNETLLTDQGNWSIRKDTLFLELKIELKLFKIVNENLLSTFPITQMDTMTKDIRALIWSSIYFSKTINYYETGQIESKRSWKSISNINPDLTPYGFWSFYYENGSIKASGQYKNGRKKGEWKYYSPDGKLNGNK